MYLQLLCALPTPIDEFTSAQLSSARLESVSNRRVAGIYNRLAPNLNLFSRLFSRALVTRAAVRSLPPPKLRLPFEKGSCSSNELMQQLAVLFVHRTVVAPYGCNCTIQHNDNIARTHTDSSTDGDWFSTLMPTVR